LVSGICLAYEREIIFSEEHKKEETGKITLKDRFKLDFSIGYGFSYAQFLTGLYGLDSKYETYLDKLGMKYSESYTNLRLTATYIIHPKFGIYVGTPFGLVHTKAKYSGRQSTSTGNAFGVGDVYGGAYYQLLSQTDILPDIIVDLDANSDITKYSSLGDGVWDYTGGIQARKLLWKPFYVFLTTDYTYREKKNSVDPGDIFGYGGGAGLMFERSMLEASLKAARIGTTKIGGDKWFDATDDLAFNLTYRTLAPKPISVSFTMGDLDEGFHWEKNYFGIEFTMAVF